MSDILKVAIPAAIALAGTVLTIYFAYRQWKRQQAASRYESYFVEKQAAYKELWLKLEDVHLKLRTDEVPEPEFGKLVLDVNAYILRHGLYLDEYDRDLSNEYLNAVRKMKKLVIESHDDEALLALTTSLSIPDDVMSSAKELKEIVSEVDRIRSALIERFRQMVGGESA